MAYSLTWLAAAPGSTDVQLWDVDPQHPGGYAWVVAGQSCRAALTPIVLGALASGAVVQIADPATTTPGYDFLATGP